MKYENSLTSAMAFAKEEKLDQWIHAYLCSDGNNVPYSDGLKKCERYFVGPIWMPTDLFVRCCGPEEDMEYRTDVEGFNRLVEGLMEAISSGADIPPLMCNYLPGNNFVTNDGNHRLEAYKRLGRKEVPVIIWITEPECCRDFLVRYDRYAAGAPDIRR